MHAPLVITCVSYDVCNNDIMSVFELSNTFISNALNCLCKL